MSGSKLSALNAICIAHIVFLLAACNNSSDIPFPIDETEFPQPVSKPVKFSEPRNVVWSDTVREFKPLQTKLEFGKLVVHPFDTTGFLPLPKPPEEIPFDLTKIPDTTFNYDKLPTDTLKFETAVLDPPKVIKAGRPYLQNSASPIYGLGEIQGLLGQSIMCLFQDSKGFLWIATNQGLYRYDGENFLLYISGNFDFFNNGINYMLEDKQGRIWASTFHQGLMVLDTKAGIIKYLNTKQSPLNNGFLQMLCDHEGRVWVSSFEQPVAIIDENKHTIKRFGKESGLKNNSSFGCCQDRDNHIVVAANGSAVCIINLVKGSMKRVDNAGMANGATAVMCDSMNKLYVVQNGIVNIIDQQRRMITRYDQAQGLKGVPSFNSFIDRQGNVWVGTGKFDVAAAGIEIIDPAGKRIKKINAGTSVITDYVYSLVQDRQDQVWIGTRQGLFVTHRNAENIEHLGTKDITTLAEDGHGQIWVGVFRGAMGVDIFDPKTGLARTLTRADGLKNDTAQNLFVENGNVWLATNNGIHIIDSALTTIRYIGKQQGLTSTTGTAITKDQTGKIWIGTAGVDPGGADVIDFSQRTIRYLKLAQNGWRDTAVSDIKADSHGRIWIATFTGGIYVVDPSKNIIKKLDSLPGQKNTNKLLLPDKNGDMYLGTAKGVFKIYANDDSIVSFSTREGLLNDNVISLNEYSGRIYAGTKGGLSVITLPTNADTHWHVRSYGKNQKMSKVNNTYASDIITTNGTFLWGDVGITLLRNDTSNATAPPTFITSIDIFNQPQYFSAKPWAHLNERDTLMSAGGDTFYVKGQTPVNTMFLQQEKMKWDSLNDLYNMPEGLRLPYFQNYLQFHFTQANLGSVDTTWYRYILEGADKKWSDKTFNAYSKNYLDLPTGTYTFKVASLFNGKWSEPVKFQFTIAPPWWQTWWAYAAYVMVFAGLVWIVARYRSRKLIKENLRLEEKITQRTNELRKSLEELRATQTQLVQSEKMASLGELTAGIAHEIQNPLNFVNNFSDINNELIEELRSKRSTPNNDEEQDALLNDIFQNNEKISLHGRRADSIVKNMLQHSRISSGQKEPTRINALADEYLRLAYHGMRAKDKSFNAALKTDFDDTVGTINVVSQDIGRVLLNLYNNAFYAVAAKEKNLSGQAYVPTITIVTKNLTEKIEIRVSDNGTGIPQHILDKIFQPFFTTKPTGQGTGLGLSLSYDIIKAHGGEIKVETKANEGAGFIIFLPKT